MLFRSRLLLSGGEAPKKPGTKRKPLCQVPRPLDVPSPTAFCKRHATRFAVAPLRFKTFSDVDWCCSSIRNPTSETRSQPRPLGFPHGKSNAGEVDGPTATTPSKTNRDAGANPLFPPRDRALIHALACERIAETGEPLSRQSLADLVRRSQATLGQPISRSTVWRMLHEAAIKPWQYQHWLFPKDPRFAEKAGPILELYAGVWDGQPLGSNDFVLSLDEKTSIQARGRCHEETPPQHRQTRRIESEYERNGALQYLAAWDVRRGIVVGRCEKKTGIKPFSLLVDRLLECG